MSDGIRGVSHRGGGVGVRGDLEGVREAPGGEVLGSVWRSRTPGQVNEQGRSRCALTDDMKDAVGLAITLTGVSFSSKEEFEKWAAGYAACLIGDMTLRDMNYNPAEAAHVLTRELTEWWAEGLPYWGVRQGPDTPYGKKERS